MTENMQRVQVTAIMGKADALKGDLQAQNLDSMFSAFAKINLADLLDYALKMKKYEEALFLVTLMAHMGHTVDRSKRWHWVRQLSVNTGFFEQTNGLPYPRSEEQRWMFMVQVAILRLTGPLDDTPIDQLSPVSAVTMVERQPWKFGSEDGTDKSIGVHVSKPSELAHPGQFEKIKSCFRIIEDTPGHLRERLNVSPARYFASSEDAVSLACTAPLTTHHRHPVVPNLHYMKDVLHPSECIDIICAAEAVGFLPDIPILEGGVRDCTRALYFYWVIDDAFNNKLWSRVKQFVPEVFAGKQVRGINRWFRLYKYVPGQEFPAHFDGAWPPSGIDPKTDKYVEDASPPGAKQETRLTFLIYLNDDFDLGGETTFFLPSAIAGNVLNAYPVRPKQGSVLLFPHGELEEAVFHEGTTVPDTASKPLKYVIRTEVVYDA